MSRSIVHRVHSVESGVADVTVSTTRDALVVCISPLSCWAFSTTRAIVEEEASSSAAQAVGVVTGEAVVGWKQRSAILACRGVEPLRGGTAVGGAHATVVLVGVSTERALDTNSIDPFAHVTVIGTTTLYTCM